MPPVWVRILPLDRLQDSGEVSTKRAFLSGYKEEQQLFSSKYIICGTATFFLQKTKQNSRREADEADCRVVRYLTRIYNKHR